jgi:hypothetical protein
MKTLELSTNLLPLINVGTYDGQICDVNNFIDDYTINEEYKEGYINYDSETYWDNFDNKKYKTKLFKLSNEYLIDNIKQQLIDLNIGILDIQCINIHSPQYYNFSTDTLNFNLSVTDDFNNTLINLINNLDYNDTNSLSKFLKDNFTSRDGFMSFTDNNITDLINSINDFEDREISAFLTWYLKGKDIININNWSEFLYENIQSYDYTEFLSDDFVDVTFEIRNHIIDYTNQNYTIKDTDTIISDLREYFEYDDVDDRLITDLVLESFKKIDDNTLKLF